MKLRPLLALAALCACPTAALAHHLRYTADLTGAAELPGNNSGAIGHAVVTIDFDLLTMQVDTTFSGLKGTVLAAHIHGPTVLVGEGIAEMMTQVPTFVDFPVGETEGSYDHLFDLSDQATYNPAFIASTGGAASDAMNGLFAALNDGKAYFNIRTSEFGDGEIRGFLSHVEGDYNLNGVVDAADYVVWRHTFGEIGDGLVADASENSVIDADDFDAWRGNFGSVGLGFSSSESLSSNLAVPEPFSTPTLATLCVVLSVPRFRRCYGTRRNTASTGR